MNPQPNERWDWFMAQHQYLLSLRAEFPHFGIIADFRRPIWLAVRGRLVVSAPDGIGLREHLRALTR